VFPIFLSSSFSVICSHTSLTETFPHSSHHRFTLRTPTKPLFGEGNVKKDSSTSTQFEGQEELIRVNNVICFYSPWLCPIWHPILFKVHYFWPIGWPIGYPMGYPIGYP
jgi:hypothetical protein